MNSDMQPMKQMSKDIRHFLLLLFTIHFSLFTLSCGPDGDHFEMKGKFKGFNQGELYIYATDGPSQKLDTIAIINGSFEYSTTLDGLRTYVIVFPNFSELPIIGQPGKKVTVEGDASHLKEVEVKGTKENEAMTAFRLQTSQMTPPEVVKTAEEFINDNPQALASIYILNKVFIQSQTPDYDKALELATVIMNASPENHAIAKLKKQLEGLKNYKEKGLLPKFTVTDIDGKTVSNVDLYAKVNVISTWASWNYDSQNAQRKLKRLERMHGSQLKFVSICLDASKKECRKNMDRDSIRWHNICDGKMWETPILGQLGLYFLPDNIITDSKGKIIAHSITTNELERKIEELLK
ncbi:MAG: DUF4369 domain-containing protein [Prevotella sp.]|nr:DUF4369 domain-containing protein [Prevotella sp.]MBO7538907.1 DUF4369 domain-containing protein [Prevotella sp.]